MLPLLVLAASAVAFGEKVKIGDIKTLHHAVSGEVYALDDKTLMVQNFNYDGAGPDAFFWVGVDGTPAETTEETTAILAHPFQGVHYKYRDESAPVLKAASNEAVTLILPEGMKVQFLVLLFRTMVTLRPFGCISKMFIGSLYSLWQNCFIGNTHFWLYKGQKSAKT